jgi:hypothetical protein
MKKQQFGNFKTLGNAVGCVLCSPAFPAFGSHRRADSLIGLRHCLHIIHKVLREFRYYMCVPSVCVCV